MRGRPRNGRGIRTCVLEFTLYWGKPREGEEDKTAGRDSYKACLVLSVGLLAHGLESHSVHPPTDEAYPTRSAAHYHRPDSGARAHAPPHGDAHCHPVSAVYMLQHPLYLTPQARQLMPSIVLCLPDNARKRVTQHIQALFPQAATQYPNHCSCT